MQRTILGVILVTILSLSLAAPAAAAAPDPTVTLSLDYRPGFYHSENLGHLTGSAQGPLLIVDARLAPPVGLRLQVSHSRLSEIKKDDAAVSGAGGRVDHWDLLGTRSFTHNSLTTRFFGGWSEVTILLDDTMSAAADPAVPDGEERQYGPIAGVEADLALSETTHLTGNISLRPLMRLVADGEEGDGWGFDFRAAAVRQVHGGLALEAGYASSSYHQTWDRDGIEREQCVYGFFAGVRGAF